MICTNPPSHFFPLELQMVMMPFRAEISESINKASEGTTKDAQSRVASSTFFWMNSFPPASQRMPKTIKPPAISATTRSRKFRLSTRPLILVDGAAVQRLPASLFPSSQFLGVE